MTHFLSFPVAGKVDGQDDAKAGSLPCVYDRDGYRPAEVTLNPIADTGFKAQR